MQRVAEQLARVRKLYNTSEIHDGDPVGQILHHRQVMGDENIGQSQLFLQFTLIEQLEYLRLNGYIQRGDRLVADDQLRIDGECSRDTDALALSARKLVGIAGHVFPRKVHVLQQPGDPLYPLLTVFHAEFDQRILQGAVNGERRVQGGIGILKYNLNLLTGVVHLLTGQLTQILPPVLKPILHASVRHGH